jgi:hypothetical protein
MAPMSHPHPDEANDGANETPVVARERNEKTQPWEHRAHFAVRARVAGVGLRVLECPRCGAPLPRRALLVRLSCSYCHSDVTVDRWGVKAADYRGSLENYLATKDEVVRVERAAWRIARRLATGHSTDVFLGERATRLRERAVLKLLRTEEDEPLLRNEQTVLAALEQSKERGAEFFSTLLPQRVAFGRTERAGKTQLAAVFREPIGFSHTLADVCAAYPEGLDPRHVAWLWARLLELLDWVHRSGWVHGALLPSHVLVDAREHGARLVGWSCAARPGERLVAIDPRDSALYPTELRDGKKLSARSDLTMLARSMLLAAGAGGANLPPPLRELFDSEANGSSALGARKIAENLRAVARRCFGPPAFVKLELPRK